MINSQLNSDEREERFYWFNEWPTTTGFYWLRGWRHYGDLPISVDGDTFWMMFNLARNHRTDLDDSEDVQFLGPITPYSSIVGAIAMRDKCVAGLRATGETFIPVNRALEIIDEAFQSLTLDQEEQQKQTP